MEKKYPINMFEAMAEMSVCEFVIPKEITTDRLLGFEYAFSSLKLREQMMLEMRYKEGQSRNQIGKEFGISGSRVHQIEMRALRQLQRPELWKYIDLGLKVAVDLDKKIAYDIGFEAGFKAGCTCGCERTHESSNRQSKTNTNILQQSIDHLDISRRAYHCLKAKGYDTIGAVVKINHDQIQQLRNFGINSQISVSNALFKCGILGFEHRFKKLYKTKLAGEFFYKKKACIGGKIASIKIYFHLPIAF